MPASITKPVPFAAAVERLRSRTPVISDLTSAEWARVPLELRDRAFLSAQVDAIRTTAKMRDTLDQALSLPPDKAFIDRSRFVRDMRQFLGAKPGDSGNLTDLTSRRRLELIYEHNMTDAYEAGRWKAGQDADLLDAYPCQELVREESRMVPRDWVTRWISAGGKVYAGRMIARKDDPIWSEISRFGNPWPPFDFGSGMGVEDVSRDDAVALGVIKEGDTIKPQERGLNDNLEASIAELAPVDRQALQDIFGDQLVIEGDKAVWQGRLMANLYKTAIDNPNGPEISLGKATPYAIALAKKEAGIDLNGELKISPSRVRHILNSHGTPMPEKGIVGETDPNQRPLTQLDIEVIPHVWRTPDAAKNRAPRKVELQKTILGETRMITYERSTKNNLWEPKSLLIKR